MKRGQNQRSTRPAPKKGNSSTGGIVILILILGLVSAFLVFKEPLKGMIGAGIPSTKPATSSKPSTAPATTPAALPATTAPRINSSNQKDVLVVEGGNKNPELVAPSIKPTAAAKASPAPVRLEKPAGEKLEDLKKTNLYWIQVSDDGLIHLQKSSRSLRLGESPMSTAVRTLLKGPSADELNDGMLSLVPAGTQLLSAYVQNRTAYMNFSDEFQFNSMGSEGIKGQLRQIVYTATEFDTVDSVQILINGKKVQYLGGDGFFVGKALGRSSF